MLFLLSSLFYWLAIHVIEIIKNKGKKENKKDLITGFISSIPLFGSTFEKVTGTWSIDYYIIPYSFLWS